MSNGVVRIELQLEDPSAPDSLSTLWEFPYSLVGAVSFERVEFLMHCSLPLQPIGSVLHLFDTCGLVVEKSVLSG